jgi:hypothetical protein
LTEQRTLFAGVPSFGDDSKPKVLSFTLSLTLAGKVTNYLSSSSSLKMAKRSEATRLDILNLILEK